MPLLGLLLARPFVGRSLDRDQYVVGELRGRAGFSFLVIGLLSIVGENDRTLAAIRVLDVRARQMQGADHRLTGVGPYLFQRRLQPFPR